MAVSLGHAVMHAEVAQPLIAKSISMANSEKDTDSLREQVKGTLEEMLGDEPLEETDAKPKRDPNKNFRPGWRPHRRGKVAPLVGKAKSSEEEQKEQDTLLDQECLHL